MVRHSRYKQEITRLPHLRWNLGYQQRTDLAEHPIKQRPSVCSLSALVFFFVLVSAQAACSGSVADIGKFVTCVESWGGVTGGCCFQNSWFATNDMRPQQGPLFRPRATCNGSRKVHGCLPWSQKTLVTTLVSLVRLNVVRSASCSHRAIWPRLRICCAGQG